MHAEQAVPRGCSFGEWEFSLGFFWSPGKRWNSVLGVSERLGQLQERGGFFIPYSCSVFQQKIGIESKEIGVFLGPKFNSKRGQELKNLFQVCCDVAVQIFQKADRQ